MNFRETEQRLRDLRRQLDAGTINSAEFDDQREQLKLRDGRGTWWLKGRDEGVWYYWNGNAWARGFPPELQDRADQPPIEHAGSQGLGPGVRVQSQSPQAMLWMVLGIVCALVSLLLVPVLFGALGIFFGYLAKRQGRDVGGIALMLASGVCMFFGIIIGILVGTSSY